MSLYVWNGHVLLTRCSSVLSVWRFSVSLSGWNLIEPWLSGSPWRRQSTTVNGEPLGTHTHIQITIITQIFCHMYRQRAFYNIPRLMDQMEKSHNYLKHWCLVIHCSFYCFIFSIKTLCFSVICVVWTLVTSHFLGLFMWSLMLHIRPKMFIFTRHNFTRRNYCLLAKHISVCFWRSFEIKHVISSYLSRHLNVIKHLKPHF